jgi:ABC-type multidrug transport system fused ATPase/permease subunit
VTHAWKLTCNVVSGTLRSNLDPFNQHEDAVLWDALKRSCLVDNSQPSLGQGAIGDTPSGSGAQTPANRFTLDTVIEDEGANLSIGQVKPTQ